MPSMCRPLRAACCLAVLAAARRERLQDAALAGPGRAGEGSLASEEPTPEPKKPPVWLWSDRYFVFVKKGALGKIAGLAGWHTETSFCVLKSPQDEEAVKQLLQPQLDNDVKSMAAELVEEARQYFGTCLVTGHAGTSSASIQEFAGTKFFWFQGPIGERKLYYVGHADFSKYWAANARPYYTKERALAFFIEDMRICGNWEREDYSLLSANCNHYTDALMKALHFRTPTTHFPLERDRDEDLGYMDVQEGVCKGAKCGSCRRGVCKKVKKDDVETDVTACFWIPQMMRIDAEKHLPGTEGCQLEDICEVGFCNEGGDFDPETHACAA